MSIAEPASVLRRCGDHQCPSSGCAQHQPVRREGSADGAGEVPASVRNVLNSPGSPISPQLSREMQDRLRADLSGVRIHHDTAAASSARDIGAKAWTLGRHVAFGSGAFAPGTESGRRLLAHELAHAVQQSSSGEARLTPATRVGSVNDPEEAPKQSGLRRRRAPTLRPSVKAAPTMASCVEWPTSSLGASNDLRTS